MQAVTAYWILSSMFLLCLVGFACDVLLYTQLLCGVGIVETATLVILVYDSWGL
jgi:hypothetical protein